VSAELLSVRFYDHARVLAEDRGALLAAAARVIDGGKPDWGPEVPGFEAQLADLAGTGFAVGCCSGTAALSLALRAVGVGPGDRVATVANTDGATPSAILGLGAVPAFVDIEPASRCMDPALLEKLLAQGGIRAVLSVDMHGHPADLPRIAGLAQQAGVPLVSDACLSLGARIGDRPATALADIACVSFGAGKIGSGIGPGGACLTSDPGLARTLRMLAGYGQDRGAPSPWLYETVGLNLRLTEMQAAMLSARLPRLAWRLATRRAQAAAYLDGLADLALDLPVPRAGCLPSWRNFVIAHDRRDRIAVELAGQGIETGRHYSPPMHVEPAFAAFATDLPVTEAAAARLLCLPIGPHLSAAQIDRVIAALRDLVGTRPVQP